MNIILDDIGCGDLYPFTFTRSVADIRIGILTIREKWQRLLKQDIKTVSESGRIEIENARLIPSNIIPTRDFIKKLKQKADVEKLINNAVKINFPWDIFQNNDWAIRKDFELLTRKRFPKAKGTKKLSPTNKIIGNDIFIEEGAIVEHSILNASTGPIYIGKNAEVLEGCNIRGPFAMCEKSLLKMGAKVYGATTIGPHCIAAGEIKNSILFGYSNKAHDGYLGDSVIGEWCNLGAGTSNSNIKNTAGDVKVWNNNQQKFISSGLKCGLIMGDYSRSAINTSFNTGTVVGVACNVFCEGFPPKYIPDFSWGNENYDIDRALQHINNWKKLKGKSISGIEKKILSDIYHQKNKNA
jgi:UDP-N-acetylglucosamine diphosphorylase/glucosamine-1-phosphate N-acetyltransferase